MSPLAPLAPAVTHSTTRLTHAEAAAQLATFLTHTDAHPAYRPDSTLSAAGPVSSSSTGGGAGTNLTLAHLRRVLTGLQGRRVGGVLPSTAEGQGEEEDGRPAKRPRVHIEVDEDGQVILGEEEEKEDHAQAQQDGREDNGVMWQEKDDFELAQGEVLQEAAEEQQAAQPAVGAGSGSGEVVRPEEVEVAPAGSSSGKKRVSKEERKREKKERWAETKRKADENKRKAA